MGEGESSQRVGLVAFADFPTDARSACVAVIPGQQPDATDVQNVRPVGAPYVLALRPGSVEWWLQRRARAELHEKIPTAQLTGFFEKRRADFNPDRIFRAKTRGMFQPEEQLTFVDAGLMPMVEGEIGRRLSALMGRVVRKMLSDLAQPTPSDKSASQVFRTAFCLLAGKLLHDKRVPSFKTLDIRDIDEVFKRVERHYGVAGLSPPFGGRWNQATRTAAEEFAAFAPLGNVTTESLAYLYESTLVPKNVRKALGIHSTPSYLVDYIVWQMADWIEELPPNRRHVFEPACGHGAFLVSSIRLLRELLGDVDIEERKAYLRSHVHGLEIDEFALEIARLSLTLADIPNPNGWDLQPADMFATDILDREAGRAGVILANPPFENFSAEDRARYKRRSWPTSQVNKAAELVARILPRMQQSGGVLGLVVPQGFLHSRHARVIRGVLLRDFEIREVCLLPDKVFEFADSESAVLLARRSERTSPDRARISFRAVRERDFMEFRCSYRATWAQTAPAVRFVEDPVQSLMLPELDEVWTRLARFPRLSSIANVAQGLFFRGRDLPRNAVTTSPQPRQDFVPGFRSVPRKLQIHETPPVQWLNVSPDVVDRIVGGAWTGEPQVVVNYAPVSRGPWRLKAVCDQIGRAATSRFLTVRPTGQDWPIEFLFAVCNSPIANAFMYSHCLKRDNLAGQLRAVPLPLVTTSGVERVTRAAVAYLAHMGSPGRPLRPEPDPGQAKHLLLVMDAELLRLYDLPPRLERQLLDLFDGHQRAGVPKFTSYYPQGFRPFVPLHMMLSEEYERTTAGELRRRATPEKSEAVLSALSVAVELFKED